MLTVNVKPTSGFPQKINNFAFWQKMRHLETLLWCCKILNCTRCRYVSLMPQYRIQGKNRSVIQWNHFHFFWILSLRIVAHVWSLCTVLYYISTFSGPNECKKIINAKKYILRFFGNNTWRHNAWGHWPNLGDQIGRCWNRMEPLHEHFNPQSIPFIILTWCQMNLIYFCQQDVLTARSSYGI